MCRIELVAERNEHDHNLNIGDECHIISSKPARRAALCIGVVLTRRSVPELSSVQHQLASKTGVVFLAVGVLEPDPEQR